MERPPLPLRPPPPPPPIFPYPLLRAITRRGSLGSLRVLLLDSLSIARLVCRHVSMDRSVLSKLEAGEAGGTLPAVLNAANEVAVDAFRNRKLSFPGIWQTVESAMGEHNAITDASLEQIIEADAWAREVSLAKINGSSQAHS